uniref:AB hydrolase-1 domain-containing protein n=1 Tax=Corethron hystrix TaxID=216773 RepID=A0A7S1FV15_9STRA
MSAMRLSSVDRTRGSRDVPISSRSRMSSSQIIKRTFHIFAIVSFLFLALTAVPSLTRLITGRYYDEDVALASPAQVSGFEYGTLGGSSNVNTNAKEEVEKDVIRGVMLGEGEHEDIPYIRCTPTEHVRFPQRDRVEILLLHGMKFHKETWLRWSNEDGKYGDDDDRMISDPSMGMLGELCKVVDVAGGRRISLGVHAIDLSVRAATANRLMAAMRLIYGEEIGKGSPPMIVVSPSASGAFVVDWITTGGKGGEAVVPPFGSVVAGWIPVACPAVLSKGADILAATSRTNSTWPPVLAINGSKDKGGQRSTEILAKDYMSGRVVEVHEIKGGSHPAYLDDSGNFITAVLDFVKTQVIV